MIRMRRVYVDDGELRRAGRLTHASCPPFRTWCSVCTAGNMDHLVASVLSRTLGSFVEGINASDLNISLLKGSVSLQNVKIRPDVLQQLDVPVRVSAGIIGAIEIDASWTQLASKPLVVSLSKLHFFMEAVDVVRLMA